MNDEFKKHLFKAGLKKLLNPDSHFCIIDFDSLMKVAGIGVTTQTRDALRLLHCVKYADMPAEVKQGLIQTIMDLIQQGPDPLREFAARLEEKPTVPQITFSANWMQRLLGR